MIKKAHRRNGAVGSGQSGAGQDVAVNIEEHGRRKRDSRVRARIPDDGVGRRSVDRWERWGHAPRSGAASTVDGLACGAAGRQGLARGRRAGKAVLKLSETCLHEAPVAGSRLRVSGSGILAHAPRSPAQAAFGETLIAPPFLLFAGPASLVAAGGHGGSGCCNGGREQPHATAGLWDSVAVLSVQSRVGEWL